MTEMEQWLEKHDIHLEVDWFEAEKKLLKEGRERFVDWLPKMFGVRREAIEKFGFAVLTTETVERLRPYAPILEIGAGSGYWTYELQKAGIDAIATDPSRRAWSTRYPRRSDVTIKLPHWIKVEHLQAEDAIHRHPDRSLLMVWPDYNKPWAASAVRLFRRSGGRIIIYVGEGDGGCTGDDALHDELRHCTVVERISIPRWYGINDSCWVYSREIEALSGMKGALVDG